MEARTDLPFEEPPARRSPATSFQTPLGRAGGLDAVTLTWVSSWLVEALEHGDLQLACELAQIFAAARRDSRRHLPREHDAFGPLSPSVPPQPGLPLPIRGPDGDQSGLPARGGVLDRESDPVLQFYEQAAARLASLALRTPSTWTATEWGQFVQVFGRFVSLGPPPQVQRAPSQE